VVPEPHDSAASAWTLVVPVRHGEEGKTRLRVPDGVTRSDLARAMATDAIAAVRGCEQVARVVLVTPDPVLRQLVGGADDVELLDDPGGGLAAAVTSGVERALHTTGRTGSGAAGSSVAVLLADLPCLQPADLDAALHAAAAFASAVVPDAEGTGSVLLTGRPGTALRPAFGAGSAVRHEALGAHRLALDLPRLRRDVDTAEALDEAVRLGVGPRTRAVLDAATRSPAAQRSQLA